MQIKNNWYIRMKFFNQVQNLKELKLIAQYYVNNAYIYYPPYVYILYMYSLHAQSTCVYSYA